VTDDLLSPIQCAGRFVQIVIIGNTIKFKIREEFILLARQGVLRSLLRG
jgi:hypothetical protein